MTAETEVRAYIQAYAQQGPRPSTHRKEGAPTSAATNGHSKEPS